MPYRPPIPAREKQAGGWGVVRDDQTCQSCGKLVCGANTSRKRRYSKSTRCVEPVCHQYPGHGTDHLGYGKCGIHMGHTPAVKEAAGRQQIRQMMRRYGQPIEDIDPEEALREEICRTVGHVRWLADKVAGVSAGAGDDGRVIEMDPAGSRAKDRKPDLEAGEDPISRQIDQMINNQPTGDEELVWGVTGREVQDGGEGGGFDKVTAGAGMNMWLQVYMAERGHLAKCTDIALRHNIQARRMDWAEAMASRLIDSFEGIAAALGHDVSDPAVRVLIASSLEAIVGAA